MKTRNANELLLKVQRGATAGFNTQDWLCCLEALGWPCAKVVVDKETRVDVRAPNGAGFTIRKQPGYRVVTFYDFVKWARANGLAAAVEAVIGAPARKPSRPEVEANTGTCPCCFGGFKLKDSTGGYLGMVFHGYRRPGSGYTVGSCFGVGYAPYEVNCLGTERFLEVVRAHAAQLVARIKALRDQPELLWVVSGVGGQVISKGDYRYQIVLADQIRSVEAELRQTRADIASLEAKIRDWKPVALPGT